MLASCAKVQSLPPVVKGAEVREVRVIQDYVRVPHSDCAQQILPLLNKNRREFGRANLAAISQVYDTVLPCIMSLEETIKAYEGQVEPTQAGGLVGLPPPGH